MKQVSKPRILLLGCEGQVGWELSKTLPDVGQVFPRDRTTIDLTNPRSFIKEFNSVRPDVVVNAAAYTNVDSAEIEFELANQVNGKIMKVIAEECSKTDALLIHYSTDYVFDGSKVGSYDEGDPPRPINLYGASKLMGEGLIREVGCDHLILRTSWVYSHRRKNFLKTILRLVTERTEIRVVADQFGTPTSAYLISDVTKELINKFFCEERSDRYIDTYHLTADGSTSWHGFANEILRQAIKSRMNVSCCPASVLPISTDEFPTPAERPKNSILSTCKLTKTFDLKLPRWEEQVCKAVDKILSGDN